jgi:predicted ATPase/transcriptional regulator with XRE-family HTH domain
MRKSADRSFGTLLREFRLAANLSQAALAERAAMSPDGISALERGVNKAPQRETLALIIDALPLEPQQRHAIEAAAQRPARPRRVESRGRKRHSLPRLVSPLFGREHDLADIGELIAGTQVVTLTGAGGVGKTRLAVQVGHEVLDNCEDGVWFVDLAAVRESSAVMLAIAGALRVRERADELLSDAVAHALRSKKLLLILDNCEHVASAAAAAVEAIAAGCPDVRILATSRQPLGVRGERMYRLGSLSLEASVALFSETAKHADPSFSPDGDLHFVERICRRLDGIALAIELAAARVRLLSLPQIEELLSERFAVLTGGGPLARHQTMRALIDWSYEQLSAEEQALFGRLGVFPAEFSFEAARAICSGGGIAESRVLDVLGLLVDKSLLTSERHGRARRFRLLETMRAYGLEKLGGGINALNARHAHHYLELVESVDVRTPNWADVLEAEYDNLRRVLEWTVDERADVALGVRLLWAMREFLLSRGIGADAIRRVERALGDAIPLSKQMQAKAWETIALMRGQLLLPAEALEAAACMLQLYEELEDNAGLARALRLRAVSCLRLGDSAGAEVDLQRSLELSRSYGDSRDVMRTLGSIAVSYEMSGRLQEGRQATLEVLDMARREGDERIISVNLMNLAEAEFALGEAEGAVRRTEELLANRATRKNVRLRANAKSNLAAYLLSLRRDEDARAAARAAVFDAREAGDAGVAACAIQHLATILARSDPQTAAKLLGFVDEVFLAQGYQRERTERYTHDVLMDALHEKLGDDEIAELTREGAAMTESRAIHAATRNQGSP